MKIDIDEQEKYVNIWLANNEKNDANIEQQLKCIYEEYKEKKYIITVFKSGKRNLSDFTSDLICYNRNKMA